MVSGRVMLLFMGLVFLVTEVTSQEDPDQCFVPTWPEGLEMTNPLEQYSGKVVLVALVKGYCGYCVHQAMSLQALQTYLVGRGYPNIEIVLVNGGEDISRINIHNFDNAVNLTILQDTSEHVLFRQVFKGRKDDFVVYDRCGQRAFHIPHPYSSMNEDITERVLRYIYHGRGPCHCSLDAPFMQRQNRRSRQRSNRRTRRSIQQRQNAEDSIPEIRTGRIEVVTTNGNGVPGCTWCQRFSRTFEDRMSQVSSSTESGGIRESRSDGAEDYDHGDGHHHRHHHPSGPSSRGYGRRGHHHGSHGPTGHHHGSHGPRGHHHGSRGHRGHRLRGHRGHRHSRGHRRGGLTSRYPPEYSSSRRILVTRHSGGRSLGQPDTRSSQSRISFRLP